MKDIKFSVAEPFEGLIKEPTPAKKCIPEWYKKMQSNLGGPEIINSDGQTMIADKLTMKSCPPILDLMCTGYILHVYLDILFTKTYAKTPEEGPDYMLNHNMDHFPAVSYHGINQVTNSNLHNQTIYKITSPWSIKTPKGYSCLFMSPYFLDTQGINIIPAIVDTDVHSTINFPFTFRSNKEKFLLEKDTPFVQVIPFKREDWKSHNDVSDMKSFHRQSTASKIVLSGWYKKLIAKHRRIFL